MATRLNFGIPDVNLTCGSGERINPSGFAGHQLIVLFIPEDPDTADSELGHYSKHCAEFGKHDAWLIAIGQEPRRSGTAAPAQILIAQDPDHHGWEAFCDLIHNPEKLDRASGATFLFTRGGNLHRFWHGPGHVQEVVDELRSPASEILPSV